MFDYIVDDMDSIKNLKDCDAITKLIVEWCLDDNGINILYKNIKNKIDYIEINNLKKIKI